MPSDPRTQLALKATAESRTRHRAAVAALADLVDSYLDRHHAADDDGARAERAALGTFAAGRVDAVRIARLFAVRESLAAESAAALARASGVLRGLLAAGDDAYVVRVPAGADLADAVRRAYATLGRAFGAALLLHAVRTGVALGRAHEAALEALPFARWNAAERELAPTLVIELEGADLRAEALAELLDGQTKLVLVPTGRTPDAPLVRLITPDVLVMQTSDADDLATLAAFDGPAIAALVPATAARFVHDPDAGETLAERLTIRAMPAEVPNAALGGRSAWQQREEIAQLVVLGEIAAGTIRGSRGDAEHAENSDVSVCSAPPRETAQPKVDALAQWLLQEAGL